MSKLFLMVGVLACVTLGVESSASPALWLFCDDIIAKEVREDRFIIDYQEGGDSRNGNSYFWTSDHGMYQIRHFDSVDADADAQRTQEKTIQNVVKMAMENRKSVNLCVSQSTSPYTVNMMEIDSEDNYIRSAWDKASKKNFDYIKYLTHLISG